MLCSTSSKQHVSSQWQQEPKHLLFLSFPFQFEIFSLQVLPLFSSSSSSFFIQCRHGFLLRLICVFCFCAATCRLWASQGAYPHSLEAFQTSSICMSHSYILTFLLVLLTREVLVFPKSFMAALLLYVAFFFPLQSLSLSDSRMIENE